MAKICHQIMLPAGDCPEIRSAFPPKVPKHDVPTGNRLSAEHSRNAFQALLTPKTV